MYMEKNKSRNKLSTVGKLAQAGVWLLSAAVAVGGAGLTIMAALDAGQFLGGSMTGYSYLSRGEEIAYGVASVGGALFLLALTIAALVGLWAFWRFLKDEYDLDDRRGW